MIRAVSAHELLKVSSVGTISGSPLAAMVMYLVMKLGADMKVEYPYYSPELTIVQTRTQLLWLVLLLPVG